MHINTPPPNLLNFKNNATKQKKTEYRVSPNIRNGSLVYVSFYMQLHDTGYTSVSFF